MDCQATDGPPKIDPPDHLWQYTSGPPRPSIAAIGGLPGLSVAP